MSNTNLLLCRAEAWVDDRPLQSQYLNSCRFHNGPTIKKVTKLKNPKFCKLSSWFFFHILAFSKALRTSMDPNMPGIYEPLVMWEGDLIPKYLIPKNNNIFAKPLKAPRCGENNLELWKVFFVLYVNLLCIYGAIVYVTLGLILWGSETYF
jgi:hypothetical protein